MTDILKGKLKGKGRVHIFTLNRGFVALSLANVEKAQRQHPLPICRTKSHRLAAFLRTCLINTSPTTSHAGRTQLWMETN